MKSSDSHPPAPEESTYVNKVRHLTENAPFFEDLLILFFQQETRHAALTAGGQKLEIHPKDISQRIFAAERNVYFDKSLIQHVSHLSSRARAIYALVSGAGLAATMYVSAKSENAYVVIGSLIAYLFCAMLVLGKVIKTHYQHSYIPPHVHQYYGLLKNFHTTCGQLARIPTKSTEADYHWAQLYLGELDRLIEQMEKIVNPPQLPVDEDEYQAGDRPSGVYKRVE